MKCAVTYPYTFRIFFIQQVSVFRVFGTKGKQSRQGEQSPLKVEMPPDVAHLLCPLITEGQFERCSQS